jgi:DNA-binding NarL/FixJ family response regulator
MVRLVIADDDVKVRSAIGLILGQDQSCWQVISCVRDVQQLFETVREEKPDMVLLDWDLSLGENNSEITLSDRVQQLKNLSPKTQILVLSCKPQNKQDALNAGADAFVSKVEPPEVFLDAMYGLCEKFTAAQYPLMLKHFAAI